MAAAVLLVLAATAAGVWLAARAVGRRVPPGLLALGLALAILPFPRAFLPGETALPLEHVALTAPWLALGSPGGPYNPYLNDVVTQMLPWAQAVRLALRNGEAPWRDRWNGCGTPLAADGVSAALSPFTLPVLILPLATGFLAAAGAKLILALTGTWLWLRELAVSAGAAVFAAVAFALSLSFSQWIFFPQTGVFCLWPWILFLLERLREPQERGRATAGLAAAFGAAVLAGHPESLALGVLFAGLWIAGRFAAGDLPDVRFVVRGALAAGATAAGLTAFLLIPTALAIRASNRMVLAEQPHWTGLFSLLPHAPLWRGAATAFFPRSLGDLIHVPQIAGTTGAFPEMTLGYFGIAGWAAALLVLRPGSPRSRTSGILLGLVVVGLGTASGLWPFAEIFGTIPVLRHMFPLRFATWAAIAGPALAAFELDRWIRDRAIGTNRAGTAWLAPAALAGLAALWYLHLRPEYTAPGAAAFQKRQLVITLLLLGAVAAVLLLPGRRTAVGLAGLTALAAADLLYQWRSHYRIFPTSLLYPATPLVRFLHEQAQTPPFRVAGAGTALFPNTNVFAGVEDIRTHDPVERRDYVDFLDATAGFPPADYFKKLGRVDAPVLDFLNVRYLVAQPGWEPRPGRWRAVYSGEDGGVFENPAVLPRAFVPGRVRLVAGRGGREPLGAVDANAAFGATWPAIVANSDWRAAAWILANRDGEDAGGSAEISGYREATNSAEFEARVAPGGAWIVLSLVQDGGWSAASDGRPLPLARANGPFLALHLDDGRHRVALRYRPPGFHLGAGVSALTAAVLAVVFFVSRRRAPAPLTAGA